MDQNSILKQVATISQKTGQEVYLVGGAVRDEMMAPRLIGGYKQKDLDFVVLGSGLAFATAFAELVGEAHGTLIPFPDFDTARFVFTEESDGVKTVLMEVEFAGARTETYDETSRKPVVTPATLEQDLSRRDFTVNAMARQVGKGGKLGKIIDPYNGTRDIGDAVLRTPLDPDVTFFDDPLRMMRAARFASQLNFSIDETVLASIVRNASRLAIVSVERIKEELWKLLATPKPSIGLSILYGTRLFDYFLPEVNALSGVEEAFGYSHKDNLSHSFAVVDNIAERSDSPLLRFTGLIHDIAKPQTKQFVTGRGWTFDMHEHLGRKMARDIGRRLRLSKAESDYAAKLVRWHLQPIALMDEGITDSAVRRLIVSVGEELSDLLILCQSDITTANQKKKAKRLANYETLVARIADVIEKDKLRAFQSPLRGEEIMQLCGLKPGPTVGRIKAAIEEAILAGDIPNEYEAAKGYFEKMKETYLADVQDWEKIL